MATRFAGPLMLALGVFTWSSCSTTPTKGQVPASAAKTDEDQLSKRQSLERKLAVARLRLDHAQMEQKTGALTAKENVSFAQEELELARGKQAQFESLDGPNRQARGELDLKRAQDRTAEAAEELKQLEIMYADQDLQDMTAEFVISRGKRNAESAELSLAIQEKELASLTEHEMPREVRGLKLAVSRKAAALAEAKTEAEASRLEGEIAVLSAAADVADLEEQLAKLAAEGSE